MDKLWMKVTGDHSSAQVILAFLQADSGNAVYREELYSLCNDLNLSIKCNHPRNGSVEDGELEPDGYLDTDGDLESDGHLPGATLGNLQDILPLVELQRPRDYDVAADFQHVVAGLREIAAQLEEGLVAQATNNLRRNISKSPFATWRSHLRGEVEQVMRLGVGLEHLPQERVMMALALVLMRGVCEQAPQLLRGLFNSVLQYISPPRAW